MKKKAEKTKQKILNTFVSLCLCSYGQARPNVSEICAELDISRGTFYNHFSGIEEIVDILSQEAMLKYEVMHKELLQINFNRHSGVAEFKAMCKKILMYTTDNRDLLLILLCPEYDFPFRKELRAALSDVIRTVFKYYPEQDQHYISTFAAEGILVMGYSWLCRQDMSMESFSDLLFTLTVDSFQTVMRARM